MGGLGGVGGGTCGSVEMDNRPERHASSRLETTLENEKKGRRGRRKSIRPNRLSGSSHQSHLVWLQASAFPVGQACTGRAKGRA